MVIPLAPSAIVDYKAGVTLMQGSHFYPSFFPKGFLFTNSGNINSKSPIPMLIVFVVFWAFWSPLSWLDLEKDQGVISMNWILLNRLSRYEGMLYGRHIGKQASNTSSHTPGTTFCYALNQGWLSTEYVKVLRCKSRLSFRSRITLRIFDKVFQH